MWARKRRSFCARDLHVKWAIENDALAALDERIHIGVQYAEVRDVEWPHERRQPLRLAVRDRNLEQAAAVAGVVDDVASRESASRVLDWRVLIEELVIFLCPPGV